MLYEKSVQDLVGEEENVVLSFADEEGYFVQQDADSYLNSLVMCIIYAEIDIVILSDALFLHLLVGSRSV